MSSTRLPFFPHYGHCARVSTSSPLSIGYRSLLFSVTIVPSLHRTPDIPDTPDSSVTPTGPLHRGRPRPPCPACVQDGPDSLNGGRFMPRPAPAAVPLPRHHPGPEPCLSREEWEIHQGSLLELLKQLGLLTVTLELLVLGDPLQVPGLELLVDPVPCSRESPPPPLPRSLVVTGRVRVVGGCSRGDHPHQYPGGTRGVTTPPAGTRLLWSGRPPVVSPTPSRPCTSPSTSGRRSTSGSHRRRRP